MNMNTFTSMTTEYSSIISSKCFNFKVFYHKYKKRDVHILKIKSHQHFHDTSVTSWYSYLMNNLISIL